MYYTALTSMFYLIRNPAPATADVNVARRRIPTAQLGVLSHAIGRCEVVVRDVICVLKPSKMTGRLSTECSHLDGVRTLKHRSICDSGYPKLATYSVTYSATDSDVLQTSLQGQV